MEFTGEVTEELEGRLELFRPDVSEAGVEPVLLAPESFNLESLDVETSIDWLRVLDGPLAAEDGL